MKRVAYVAYVTCMALLLAGRVALAGTVDAAQYDTFWLWAGVKPQAVVRAPAPSTCCKGRSRPPRATSRKYA